MKINYCPSCGQRVRDDSAARCDMCNEPLPRKGKGLIGRLLEKLFGAGTVKLETAINLDDHADETRVTAKAVHTNSVELQDPITGEWRTVTDINELPEEIRSQIETLQHNASTQTQYSMIGPDGREVIYESLDEMPEHLRSMFKHFEQQQKNDE